MRNPEKIIRKKIASGQEKNLDGFEPKIEEGTKLKAEEKETEEEQKEKAQKSQKEIEWEKKRKEVDSWRDKLNHPVDEKIKETVVAFNLSGLPTTGSCEGHTDDGMPAPWIDVEAPEKPAERFFKKTDDEKIFQKLADEYNIPQKEREAYLKAFRESEKKGGPTPEFKRWRQKTKSLFKELSRWPKKNAKLLNSNNGNKKIKN